MNVKVVVLCILIGVLLLGFLYGAYAIEGFQTQDDPKLTFLNTTITTTSEIFCPIYNLIVKNTKDDRMFETVDNPDPSLVTRKQIRTEAEAIQQLQSELEKDAGGPIFQCPPPSDSTRLPADIDEIIRRTTAMYLRKVRAMKAEILEGLNKCEGFEDMAPTQCPAGCAPVSQAPTPQTGNSQAATASKEPEMTPQVKQSILDARYTKLFPYFQQEQNIKDLQQLKVEAQELLQIKAKAENGELKPNCPQ
jgi:hypothetical protein